jgi:hypothetical protein
MRHVQWISTVIFALAAQAVSAQDRPFFFTLTDPAVVDRAPIRVDSVPDNEAFTLYHGDRPESGAGVQLGVGSKVFVLGRVGTPLDRYDLRGTSQQAEALVRISEAGAHAYMPAIAAGLGVRREPDGTNVLLGRLVVGRTFAASRVYGNMLLEKAFGGGRDAADVVTSFGWSHRVTGRMSFGVEAVGEDLEGFWSTDERDGGARLLVGPSLSVVPAACWRLNVTGGPILHSGVSSAESTALRTLPSSARNGYAARASLSYAF